MKGTIMAINKYESSFDSQIIYTKEGLNDIYEMTLPESIQEMHSRTTSLTDLCQSQLKLITTMSDKIINLEDRIVELEQAMDKVFAHLDDDSIDKLILDRLKK
jgi:hypothetical protein